MISEWDDTAWGGSDPPKTTALVERERATLSLNDWAEFFRFGSNTYFADSFTQTLQGKREEAPESFAGYVQQIKKANAVAFAVMDVRRRLFSEARFMFRRLVDGRPGELFGGRDGRNPAYKGLALLGSPWPGGTTRDLLSYAIDYADNGGNTFIIRRANRLKFLRPDWTTMVVGSLIDEDVQAGDVDAELIGLVYHPGGRTSGRAPQLFGPGEFAHWAPIKDPTASYRGMSWITPIIREVLGDSATTNHKLKYFENGATPNLAVALDADISIDDAKEWIDLFRQEHEGVANAYKTLFLGGGAKPVAVGSDMQQIDFKAIQGAGETRIAAAGGTPPIIVGLSEGLASATYSNYGQARRALADLTMRPLWGGFCEAIQPLITVPPDAELWYDDSQISFLQEDVKDAAEILKMHASTTQVLFNTGFLPDDVIDAVTAGDLRRLKGKHSGLTSVQLQPVQPDEQETEETEDEPAPSTAPTNGRTPAVAGGVS